jgi:hypothetical protein
LEVLTLSVPPHRKLAFDEGIQPTNLDSELRSWVPGKPNPNGFEFMGLVDDNKYMWMLVWEKPHHGDKAGRPSAMLDLIKEIIEQLSRFQVVTSRQSTKNQPFILYLDSRFSSIEALELIHRAGMFIVGSTSVVRRPTKMWPYLREGLEKREWRTVYWAKNNAIACVVRAKKRAYVNLISNCFPSSPYVVEHTRRKYPRSTYQIVSPAIQKEYNLHKNNVDVYNKMLLAYKQETNYISEDQALLHFFVNATVINAFVWYRKDDAGTQLQFRLKLIQQLHDTYVPSRVPKVVSNNHILRRKTKEEEGVRKCPTSGCEQHPWRFCVACDRLMCSRCYDRIHEVMF